MKKLILLSLAILVSVGAEISPKERYELQIYEQMLSRLKTEQIPEFVEYIAASSLPRRLDDMVTLNSLKADSLTLSGKFTINDTAASKVSKYSQAQLNELRDSFTQNGKNFLCAAGISRAIMQRGIKFVGSYELGGKHVFDITMDKNSCK